MSWKKTLRAERKTLATYQRLAGKRQDGNVSRFFEAACQDILRETLTISHDLPLFINNIKKQFPDARVIYANNVTPKLTYKHGTPYCVDMEFDHTLDHRMDDLKKTCDFHGYIITKRDGLNVLFEPKYPVKLNIRDMKIKWLYHITATKNLPRIQAIGLTPRDSQTSHQHTGSRIYLVYTNNVHSLSILRHRLASDKQLSQQQMSVLRVDASGVESMFFDENATTPAANILALFTTINISPNNVTDITKQIPTYTSK